jgi:hypothetical protein
MPQANAPKPSSVLESERAADPRPVPRSRPKRRKEAKRRLNEGLWTEARANEAHETYRARGRMKDGRRFGGPPKPYTPPPMRTRLSDLPQRSSRGGLS